MISQIRSRIISHAIFCRSLRVARKAKRARTGGTWISVPGEPGLNGSASYLSDITPRLSRHGGWISAILDPALQILRTPIVGRGGQSFVAAKAIVLSGQIIRAAEDILLRIARIDIQFARR